MLLRSRSCLILMLNTVLVCISLIAAWMLRFEFTLPHKKVLFAALPLLILFRLAALSRFKLLHGYWRYTGVTDIADVIKAVAVGSVAFFVSERWILGVKAFPQSIYCLEALLTVAALCGARLWLRLLAQSNASHRQGTHKSVIIVGAGAAGAMLVKELPHSGFTAVGVVDDDPAKLGARIDGVPVIGGIDDLPGMASLHNVEEILIAIPSATGHEMRRITTLCEQTGARFRTIPSIADLIDGKTAVEQLRDVNIEDLLGRQPVHLDLEPVRQQLQGKVIMVTGAAGSIGSELCLQLLNYQPNKLLCVDQDESALFFLEQKLVKTAAQPPAEYHVADIADRRRMRNIMASRGVDIIFHAAAYKHVPMMETNVSEAVSNNIFGLIALLDVAEQTGCSAFLMISSDKAVKPTNVMGCTKRVCELIMAARTNTRMRRVSVRFGNVLGSQGSVIPILQEQIRKQQLVTVTHPDISRFFMTIPEAVSLVLQAFTIGKHGEILVLEMGEPMKIVDLARTLIRLCGKSEDEVEIVFTGLRKGEKLHEELFYETEKALPTSCTQVRRTAGEQMSWPILQTHLTEMDALLYSANDAMIRAKLNQVVPEYAYVENAAPATMKQATVIHLPGMQTIQAAAGAK